MACKDMAYTFIKKLPQVFPTCIIFFTSLMGNELHIYTVFLPDKEDRNCWRNIIHNRGLPMHGDPIFVSFVLE